LPHLPKFTTHSGKILTNRAYLIGIQRLIQVHRAFRYVLRAGSHEMGPDLSLKIAPIIDLLHERHLQPGGVCVVIVVRVRRRGDDKVRPVVWNPVARASITGY
jgi:hypothetical protein